MPTILNKDNHTLIVAGNLFKMEPGLNEVPNDIWDKIKCRKRVVSRLGAKRWEVLDGSKKPPKGKKPRGKKGAEKQDAPPDPLAEFEKSLG